MNKVSFQQDVYLLDIRHHGQSIGTVLVSWDSDYISFRRLTINHLSVYAEKSELLPLAIKSVVLFLFSNDPAREIRIGVIHCTNPVTEKVEVNKGLVQHFTRLAFKWKIINNKGHTSTIYGLKREHFRLMLENDALSLESLDNAPPEILDQIYIQSALELEESGSMTQHPECPPLDNTAQVLNALLSMSQTNPTPPVIPSHL